MPTSKAIKASKFFGEERYEQYLNELLTEQTIGGQNLTKEQLKEGFSKRTDKISFKQFVDKLVSTKTAKAAVASPSDGPSLISGRGVNGPKGGSLIKSPIGKIQKYYNVDNFKSQKEEKDTLSTSIVAISKSLDSILKILSDKDKLAKDTADYNRRKKEQDKRALEESKLEKGFVLLKKAAEKVLAPVKSILDKITQFLVNVILGRVVYKLIEWLADKNNADKVKSIIRFLGDNWSKLLSLYIVFGTSFGKFARGLISLVVRGTARLVAVTAALAAKAIGGKVGGRLGKVSKFLGGKKGKLIVGGIEAAATIGGTLALSKGLENFGGIGGGESKEESKPQKFSGGGLAVPRFSGGGFNFKGMLGGAGMGAMFGLLGGAMGGSSKQQPSGYVSGAGGPKDDKVPAMLSNGEFVMSAGAVQKYGVDTLEAMNAAGGGTNKPKVVGGTTYAAGGGYMGDYMKGQVKMRPATINEMTGENANLRQLLGVRTKEEAAKIVSASGNQVPDVRDLLGDKEFSRFQQGQFSKFSEGADEKTFKGLQRIYQQHFGVGKEFEKMISSRVDSRMLDRGTTPKPTSTPRPKPKVTRIDPSRMLPSAGQSSANAMRAAAKATQNVRAPIPASSAIVPYTGGGLARTGVTGGLSVPQIKTNMKVPGGFGNLKSLGAELLLSYLVQSGLDYVEAKRLASTIEKARKESPEKLANRVEKLRELVDKEERFQKSFGGVLQKVIAMGGETGSEVLSRQAKTILAGVGAKTFQGGAIKGGYGLKQQSFKDMPKTQVMTDDKGRPFVGYKAMRGGKPVYVRGPQPGTGTSNPFEALGRMINPNAYKENDQKLAMQKQKIAMVDALESFQKQGMASDAQARMMKQMGGNLKDVQNDLNYRKKTQAQIVKPKSSGRRGAAPVSPPVKQKPKVTYGPPVPTATKQRYQGGQRSGSKVPTFSAINSAASNAKAKTLAVGR